MALIEARGLCHKYGDREVLKNITLRVEGGEAIAFIGPTGAGKTTLLRLLDLLEMPTSGELYFDGVDVTQSGKLRLGIRRRMAFVLQKPLVFNMSVYDNVAYGLKWRGEEGIVEKVTSIVNLVGLSEHRNRNARTLSGGEAQRVALARALVLQPKVLFLDEPAANLDPISTSKIEELIAGIISKRYTTVVMATHDISQGQRLADRMGVIMEGQLLQMDMPRAIFNSPGSKAIARFVGMENIIEGVIVSSEAGLVAIDIGGKLLEALSPHPVGERVYACIRPEDIILSPSKTETSARNSFMGRITRIASLGSVSRVEIDCGFRLIALVTKRSAEELDLESKREIYASFKATGVHIIRSRQD